MTLGNWAFNQRRLLLILTFLFTMLGILSFSAVPKAEDPRLPDWFLTVVIILPGGEIRQIDEMIAQPVNQKLKEIDEIKKVDNTTRFNSTVFQLEMKDSVKDTKPVWDKVRRAIDDIKADFPQGTQEPKVIESANRLETILYSISGVDDILLIKNLAEDFKRELLTVPGTSQIIFHGDPVDEIQLQYKSQKLEDYSIPHGQLIQKISSANSGIPGGALDIQGFQVPIVLPTRLQNPQQIRILELLRGSGDPLRMDQITNVEKVPRRFENGAFLNQRPALFVGVVAQHPIEIVKFGQRIRQQAEIFKTQIHKKGNEFKDIAIDELSFNPDRTEERLKDLAINLLVGVLSVGIILWFWMGWKVGLVVSLFVPIISLVGFFFYSAGSGILHQISLAAFVISLGQFIDNIIVIVEWIDSKVQEGLDPIQTSVEAIDQFKKPMFFATGTNISAFIPMLASSGTTAEFTFSIPLVSIITMVAAWLLALFVVPIFVGYLFKFFPGQPSLIVDAPSTKVHWIKKFSQVVAGSPALLSLGSFGLVLLSSVGFISVKKQFFPSADRNQLVVTLELSEGTSPTETLKQTQLLISFISTLPEVRQTASFIGEDIPRFYYNVGMNGSGSNKAELLLNTQEKSQNSKVIAKIHDFAARQMPQNFVLAKNLEQGPPIKAPIEYKLFSEDENQLLRSIQQMKKLLLAEGAKNSPPLIIKDDLGEPIDNLVLTYNQDLAERFNLSEDQISMAILSATSGFPMSKFFENGKSKDIRLIGPQIDSLEQLKELPIRSSAYRNLRLKDLVQISYQKSPAVIHRLNGEKMARILAWPIDARLAQPVFEHSHFNFANIEKENAVKISVGGEVEGSGEANMAILKSIPLGLMVLIICLLLEFNSIRKMMIILLSVPLVIAGVTPGLLLGGAAFGFMSLLGVLALVGIVVNNSILLIESIDEAIEEGLLIKDSIIKALSTRTRPILLTAVTTIAGLLPMAFEESTLWPPLALAMISGLVGSTIITLVFVPSLYQISFNSDFWSRRNRKLHKATAIIAGIGLFLLTSPTVKAESYTFQQLIQSVELSSPDVAAAKAESEKLKSVVTLQKRAAYWPRLGTEVELKQQQKQLTQTNAFGTFKYGQPNQVIGGLELTQPLLNLEEMSGNVESSEHLAQAAEFQKKFTLQKSKRDVIHFLVAFLKLQKTETSLKRLEKSLLGIEAEIKKFVRLGLRGQSDLLNVQLALADNRSSQVQVQGDLAAVRQAIQIYVSDFTELQGEIPEGTSALTQEESYQGSSTVKIQRPEVDALESLNQSQWAKLRALRQGHWPTLELKARYLIADQGLLDQKNWTETALVLKWPLLEGGTRSARASVQASEIEITAQSKLATEARIKAEKSQFQAELQETSFRLKMASENLQLAQKAQQEDQKNSLNGKTPLKDWLSSEIRLEEKKLEVETLRLDKIRLQYDDLYIKGLTIE